MIYLFWLSLLLILLAILIVKFIDFISPIICDAATSVIKKTIQKYSPKPQPPKIIYNVVEKKEQPVQQYHIQLIAPVPSPQPKPEKLEESETQEEIEECEEYTEESTTPSNNEKDRCIAEDCADLLTKLVVNALGIPEPSDNKEKPAKSEKIDEEKINSLITDALNKFKEERETQSVPHDVQKPTDTTQMNIQQHAKTNTDNCNNNAEILKCNPEKQ